MKKYVSFSMFVAISFLIHACGDNGPDDKKQEILHVKTEKAEMKEVRLPVRSSGLLGSKKEMKLSFKTGGIIRDIPVSEGEEVKAGQLLAQLDLSEIRAKVEQAGLVLEKAKRDYKRVKNLYQDSVATLENLQNAETALKVAESDHAIAQFNLKHSKIIAPADGIILKRIAEENEIVAAGHPVFLFASSEGGWIVKSGITDKDIVKLSLGDSAVVYLDPYPAEKFPAFITQLGGSADPYTGTYEIELSLAKTDKKLSKGFIARVDVYPSEVEQHVLIPVDALVEAHAFKGYAWVFKNGSPERRALELGSIVDGKVIVKSGIDSGEEVVTDGSAYLQENSVLEVVKD